MVVRDCWNRSTPLRCAGSWSIRVWREAGIPAMNKGEPLPLGFRADILADEIVILEIKAVPTLLPAHDMQLQTYLRMIGLPVGLLFNFHAVRLKYGLRRLCRVTALCRVTGLCSPWPTVALVLLERSVERQPGPSIIRAIVNANQKNFLWLLFGEVAPAMSGLELNR
jgi:GxxExxY protein